MLSRIGWIAQFVLLALACSVERTWAQASQAPAAAPATDAGTKAAIVVAGVVLLVVLGVAIKLYDLKRKRDDEAVAIQARISEALMVDPSLAPLPVTTTVHVPFWRGTPVVIDVAGAVPWAGLRQVAADLCLREAQKSGKTCRLQDRIAVDPTMVRRAA